MDPHVNAKEIRQKARELRQASERVRRVADHQLHKSAALHRRWDLAEDRFFAVLEQCLRQEAQV